MRVTSRLRWQQRLTEQRQWIEAHGGSLAGYIARYGSASDPNHYGDGGEAIYEADCAEFSYLLGKTYGKG